MSARCIAWTVALVALVTLPYWISGTYYINVSSQILFYAIFALGLNIIVGYGGVVSLGHAGLFGIAAYATGYLLQNGFAHTPAILLALLIGLVSTAVFAALALRATGIGFIMITLALGQITWGLAYRWISLTGGDNGINLHGRPAPFGLELGSAPAFYYVTLVVFLVATVAVAIFVNSPFGAALKGTRDQPRRMNALTASAEVLLMVIAGGPATLLGPIVGAALVVIVKNVVSGYIERWNFLLGTIFVAIVILMPEGLVPGTARLWRGGWHAFRRRRGVVIAQSAEPKP
jgi:branched-chain amino acid transport system permease protein